MKESNTKADPAWAGEIRTLYLSGAANQFVLYGNVNDRLLIPAAGPEDDSGRLGNLFEFLQVRLLKRFEVVLSYDLGTGLKVEAEGEKIFHQWPSARQSGALPRQPWEAIQYLDHFLRYCVNLRQLRHGGGTDAEGGALAGRNLHLAIVLRTAHLVLPRVPSFSHYELNAMASLVRSWSMETHFLEQNLAVFLISEKLNDLHSLVATNPRAAVIEVPLPGRDELAVAMKGFARDYPVALKQFREHPETPAERLAGTSLGSVESLIKTREHLGKPLAEGDLAELKKDLVERDCQGLIEFVEPHRTLDDVYGQEAVKDWMRQDIALWRQGDLAAMPMGYLMCGPVGTGKTYLVECLAGEAGVPVVKLRNFRDRWVGSTEGNLEKIFSLLHALGRCIVFIDEADQALGRRDSGPNDSGVSGRVYSMMAKEMSDTRNRGRLLWILASSRPDLIEVDLKRPGRVDVKIPLFPALSAEEGYGLIRALCKRLKLELPDACPADVSDLLPAYLTAGAAEALSIKVYRQVKTRNVPAMEALRDCLDGYQHPVDPKIMQEQIDLAVKEASDLAFVPEVFRPGRLALLGEKIGTKRANYT